MTSHIDLLFFLNLPLAPLTFTGDAFATFSHDPCESRCDTCLGIAGASQEPESIESRDSEGNSPWKFNIAPENSQSQKESSLQPSFFRGYVKLRECKVFLFALYHGKSPSRPTIWDNIFGTFSKHLKPIQVWLLSINLYPHARMGLNILPTLIPSSNIFFNHKLNFPSPQKRYFEGWLPWRESHKHQPLDESLGFLCWDVHGT